MASAIQLEYVTTGYRLSNLTRAQVIEMQSALQYYADRFPDSILTERLKPIIAELDKR